MRKARQTKDLAEMNSKIICTLPPTLTQTQDHLSFLTVRHYAISWPRKQRTKNTKYNSTRNTQHFPPTVREESSHGR